MSELSDDDLTLSEVVHDEQSASERLEESAADVALGLSAAGVVLGAVQTGFTAATYFQGRQAAEGYDALRSESDDLRQQLHEMRRTQAYERGGLAGLDEFDEWHYDGPFRGFEVE